MRDVLRISSLKKINYKKNNPLKTSKIRAILIILVVFSQDLYSRDLGDSFSDSTFINPAAQLGYTFDKGWFYGFQLSLNHFFDRSDNVIGVTNGLRYYSTQKNYYLDFQHSALGISGYGIGANFILNEHSSKLNHYRVKGWYGLIGLATVDIMIPRNTENKLKYSIGAVGTLPILVKEY